MKSGNKNENSAEHSDGDEAVGSETSRSPKSKRSRLNEQDKGVKAGDGTQENQTGNLGEAIFENQNNKEIIKETKEVKYSLEIKKFLDDNEITSMDELKKSHIAFQKKEYKIQTHQVKRVANSHFNKNKLPGRPVRYPKTNQMIRDWAFHFLSFYSRAPSLDETMTMGIHLKSQALPYQNDEKDWECSKGWANKFLLRNGLRDFKYWEEL